MCVCVCVCVCMCVCLCKSMNDGMSVYNCNLNACDWYCTYLSSSPCSCL